MNEFKSIQTRHAMETEAQQVRITLVIEKLINSYNSLILEKIDIDNKSLSETKRQIQVIINKMYKNIDYVLLKELEDLGLYESNFYENLLKTKIEDPKQLSKTEMAALLAGGLFLGKTIKDSLSYQKNVFSSNMASNINVIYNQKTTQQQAKSRIRQSVLKSNNTQNQAITKTTANNILNLSRLHTFEKSGVTKYQYVAILDSKTTKICKKLDGRIFEVNDPKSIRPPQHYNCRSVIMPITEPSDKFTDEDSFDNFAEEQSDKEYITDKNGNFKLRNRDIISISERKKKDKDLIQ